MGNKVDKERVVTRAQAEEYARSKGMLFLEARCVPALVRQIVFVKRVALEVACRPDVLASFFVYKP